MRLTPSLQGFLAVAACASFAGAAVAQTQMGKPMHLDPGGHTFGQQSSLDTPMGETGSLHGGAHLGEARVLRADAAAGSSASTTDTARMGAAATRSPDRAGELNFVGQQSTHHTPMGETGTPHGHW